MPDLPRTPAGNTPGATVEPDAAGMTVTAASIRTALSLVLGPLADALDDSDNPLPPAQHERVALARRNASTLLGLVEGLMEGSVRTTPDASYVPTDLAGATREVVAMFRAAAALADVAVDVEAAPLREPVYVDRAMWDRLVVALLNGALRSAHLPVAVRMRETAEAAVLEVSSAALGDDRNAVAIARRVAEAHGGTVAIENAGARTLIRVSMPFGASHLPAARVLRAPPPVPRRTLPRPGERILVVAEDPDLRAYLRGLVETRWTTDTAVDLATAIAAAGENVPDLLLIDGDVRGGDGLALARALRADQRTRRVPMIMVAAAGPGQEAEGAIGPDEYVAKPFASRDLVSRVAAHLQMARVRDEATRREQKARLDAEAANRAKDEFIAMISHELRTPLGAILIWAQLLRAEELDATTTSRAVGMIERSTKTLAQLIDDLLDVSRIIAGKLTFEGRPVDLRYVVEGALDAAQPAAEAKGLAIERVIEAGVPPISGDAGRLQQVVGNLLANAIKFTPEGGRIEAVLERSGSRARIRVRDTGSGIRAEFLPFIFERFRQADTTSTRKQKGLGLGLAIARHIVEMHGGSIEAASAGEGQGSTFTVTVPLGVREEDADAERQSPDEEVGVPEMTLAGVRILVVDDEEDAREAMAVLLGQAGAVVQSVGSVAEAMGLVRDRAPDILLSDIAMPGEDGYALIRQVRAMTAESGGRIPAAALTAYATLEDRRKALLAGYNEHIPKPVDPIRLIAAVASLITR